MPSPHDNFDPRRDPYLARNPARTDVGGAGDYFKGLASGAAGLPSDLLGIAAALGRVKTPVGQVTQPQKFPFTTEHIGKMLNANTRSGAFNAGAIGAPDPKDLAKLAASSKLAMTLFHGTPHKFDRFSLSKIGTGEGVQAYGHGLYFAESPAVAGSYRTIGARVPAPSDNVKKALGEVDNLGFDTPQQALANIMQSPDWRVRWDARDASSVIDDYVKQNTPGHLYEVDIPDEVTNKMLDWDKPLSEQPENVKNAARRLLGDDNLGGDTGADLMRSLQQGGDPNAISEALRELGVPGIRYYDGGSRSAKEGTRNIVLFDENAINRVKRDGNLVFGE